MNDRQRTVALRYATDHVVTQDGFPKVQKFGVCVLFREDVHVTVIAVVANPNDEVFDAVFGCRLSKPAQRIALVIVIDNCNRLEDVIKLREGLAHVAVACQYNAVNLDFNARV